MTNIYEIIKKFEDSKATLEETNEALKGTGVQVDPAKNDIKEGEGAVVCEDMSKINGYAMLDSGIGNLDKVLIKDGKLTTSVGEMYVLVLIGKTMFHVAEDGVTLIK